MELLPCSTAKLSLPCYRAVARLGFKRRATAVQKSNLIRSIEFGTAAARRLKQALVSFKEQPHGSGSRGVDTKTAICIFYCELPLLRSVAKLQNSAVH